MKFSQEMPTCSSCPFFLRQRNASLDQPGECLYSVTDSLPMPQAGGVAWTPGTRLTFHFKTCHNHPAMSSWIEAVYLKEYRLSSNGDAPPPDSPGLKPDLILRH